MFIQLVAMDGYEFIQCACIYLIEYEDWIKIHLF